MNEAAYYHSSTYEHKTVFYTALCAPSLRRPTLGGTSWGGSSRGRHTGRSIEHCLVLVGGGVVICGFIHAGNVSFAHSLMAWWSACISES